MKFQPTFHQGAFALIFFGFTLASCGGESQPAEQTPTTTVDTTQAAAPAEAEAAPSALLTKFDFEHFGSYDLSTWKVMAPQTEEGGDVVIEVLTYEKDGMKMEIEESDQGEYGYSVWYRLTGADGKVQKTRSLKFTNEPFAVTESVNDYTVKPAKKYTRTQETGKHHFELKPLPTAATGAWEEGPADEL